MIPVAIVMAMLASESSALLPQNGMDAAFSGTIVSTYPDGQTALLWLERANTYQGQGRSGRRSRGVWRIKGDEIYLKQRRPIPVPVEYCTALVTGGIGARWSGRAVTGEPIQIHLVPGRAALGDSR